MNNVTLATLAKEMAAHGCSVSIKSVAVAANLMLKHKIGCWESAHPRYVPTSWVRLVANPNGVDVIMMERRACGPHLQGTLDRAVMVQRALILNDVSLGDYPSNVKKMKQFETLVMAAFDDRIIL